MTGSAIRKAIGSWQWFALMVAAFCALGYIAVSHDTRQIAWDDTYMLHRAACVNAALHGEGLSGMRSCLAHVSKSPVMSLLLLPWGALTGWPQLLGLANVSLAILNLGMVIALMMVLAASKVPAWSILLAAVSVCLSPLMVSYRGAYLSDFSMALAVAGLMALTIHEQQPRPVGTGVDVARGLLWGLFLAVGFGSKLSFGYFAVTMFPLIFWSRLRLRGLRSASIAAGMAALMVGGVGLLYLANIEGYFGHLINATVGGVAERYADGLTTRQYLARVLGSIGPAWFPLAALAIAAVAFGRGRQSLKIGVLWGLCVLGIYFALVAGSANRDDRFLFPVLVAAPFLLCQMTAAGAGRPAEVRPTTMLPALGALLAGLSLIMAFPTVSRIDLRWVAVADEVLRSVQDRGGSRVVVASDAGQFNIETLILAREIDRARLGTIHIETVVYDEAHRRSLDHSLERLAQADHVVMHVLDGSAPDWTNSRHEQFQRYLDRRACRVGRFAAGKVALYAIGSADSCPPEEVDRSSR